MTVEHFIVFVGAGRPLAEALSQLRGRISKSRVIAPAVGKKNVGVTDTAIEVTAQKLHEELSTDGDPSQVARLYLWMYRPTSTEQFTRVWRAFGHASWVETIPTSYLHNVRGTREYIENRTNEIRRLLHRISHSTYVQRKSSPLSLPLRNFTSEVTEDLRKYWYNELNEDQLSERIRRFRNRYLQTRSAAKQGYKDDRALIFKPAKDTECHGKPHPIGSEQKTFFCGRFRYGVSLFPGFHFDVSAEKSPTIQCDLWTPSGERRSVRNRRYVNIFPNDHILPEK